MYCASSTLEGRPTPNWEAHWFTRATCKSISLFQNCASRLRRLERPPAARCCTVGYICAPAHRLATRGAPRYKQIKTYFTSSAHEETSAPCTVPRLNPLDCTSQFRFSHAEGGLHDSHRVVWRSYFLFYSQSSLARDSQLFKERKFLFCYASQ